MLGTRVRRPRWWLAVIQVVLLLAYMAMPAAAATTDTANLTGQQLIDVLRSYGIVRGDENGNLNLDKPIKRAEMITIMVRAIGKEEDAKFFAGASTFTDARGHWAESNINFAAAYGLIKGDGNGLVRPEDPITYAEALTLVLRVIKQEPTSTDWPTNVMLKSAQLGLLPVGVDYNTIRQPAIRGVVFQSMAQALTTVKTASGGTYLQEYLDKVPPQLTVNKPASTTTDGTVRITGTASGATSVTVNGIPATLTGTTFSADVPLSYGNNQITVVAVDYAGNVANSSVTVTRAYPIASLDITGPTRVAPGATVTYTVTALNQSGSPVGLTGVTAEVSGNIGSFDLASGVLKASTTPARGTITVSAGNVSKSISVEVMGLNSKAGSLYIRPVNNGKAVSYTKPMQVQVEVRDEDGNLLSDDYGRDVSLLASGINGVRVTPASTKTQAGVATFTVTTSEMGTVALTASSAGLTSSSLSAVFGSNTRVVLVADPATLTLGGTITTTRIRAELRDENNQLVANNTGSDIYVKITSSGTDGYLTDDTLTIRRGYTTSTLSGDDAFFSARTQDGTASLTGTIQSGQTITVDSTTIVMKLPTVGAGSKLTVQGPSTVQINGGTGLGTSTYTVAVTDANGNIITAGSYAFQLKIETSNNETKTAGIPDGMTVQLYPSGYNPVSDGYAEGSTNDGSDIIARTVNGTATIKVTYDKSGKVTITPLAISSTASAVSSDGTVGLGLASGGLAMTAFTSTFRATPAAVVLTADSTLGNDQPGAALSTSTGSTVTLRATVTDANGNWIPGFTGTVTLNDHTGTSTAPSSTTASFVDGKATFVVRSTGLVGQDTYTAQANLGAPTGTVTSQPISIVVSNQAPPTPAILTTRGVKNGNPGAPDYVAPGDDALEMELQPLSQTGLQWVQVKVFQEGSYSPIYTSGAIDITAAAPKVTIPKASLPAGIRKYQITIRNAAGESARSNSSNPVTNATYTTAVAISRAYYDHVSKKLTIVGSGFNSADTVDPSQIKIIDISTGKSVTLNGAISSVTNGNLVLDLSSLISVISGPDSLADSTAFSGTDIRVQTSEGWYVRADGLVANAETTGKPVTPGAAIQDAVYDPINARLIVYGVGFTTGTIDFTKLSLTSASGGATYDLSKYAPVRASDTQLTFNLRNVSGNAIITDLNAHVDYVVNAASGWFKDGSSYTLSYSPAVSNAPVYAKINVTGVTYNAGSDTITITGSGFLGGSVDVSKLHVTDLSTGATLNLNTASVTNPLVSDDHIDIVLQGTDPGNFEDTAKFKGSDIYFVADPEWFTDASGRFGADLPVPMLRFPTR